MKYHTEFGQSIEKVPAGVRSNFFSPREKYRHTLSYETRAETKRKENTGKAGSEMNRNAELCVCVSVCYGHTYPKREKKKEKDDCSFLSKNDEDRDRDIRLETQASRQGYE